MRKYIFGALIGLFGLIGFSNAGLQEFDLGQIESITANSSLGYDLRLTANANFLTNDLYKVVQFKGNGQYPTTWTYFWNGTGMYVIESCSGGYSCNGNIQGQGYINYVNIVTLSTIDMQYAVNNGFTPIDDFLSNSDYSNPDKLLLGGYGDLQTSSFCFGYSDLDKAVCFTWNRSFWNNCSGYPQYCTNGQLSYITNSKGYTTQDITELASFATISPFVSVPTPQQPVNQYQCYTVQDLLNQYGEEYTPGLCQSSTIIYSGNQFITVTPKTIEELYPTFEELREDMNLYNNYCKAPATQQTCENAFNGKTEKYTIISKIPNNVNLLKLYSYCKLIELDPNGTTCTYSTGTTQGGITINDIIEEIGGEDLTIVTPGTPPQGSGDNGSGSVFDKYLNGEDDDSNRWDAIKNATKIVQQMKELYAKFGAIFRGRYGKNGIIPPLITGLLCLIVLYKLFKR